MVVTASVNGTRVFSNTGATAYSATKAGQVPMTKMLAVELARHRIRVDVVCPEGSSIPLSRGGPGTADGLGRAKSRE